MPMAHSDNNGNTPKYYTRRRAQKNGRRERQMSLRPASHESIIKKKQKLFDMILILIKVLEVCRPQAPE